MWKPTPLLIALAGAIISGLLGSELSDSQFSQVIRDMEGGGPVRFADDNGSFELKIGEDGSYEQAIESNVDKNGVKGKLKVATQTLAAANRYTDERVNHLAGLSDSFEAFRGQVDDRFRQQDRRIDKMGAMGSAMMSMALNSAGTGSPRGRIAVGVGFQNGESALSVGYGKRIGKTASFSLGGAFSGSDKSVGAGFGVDL